MSRLFRLILFCCALTVAGCGGSDPVEMPEETPAMPGEPASSNAIGQQSQD